MEFELNGVLDHQYKNFKYISTLQLLSTSLQKKECTPSVGQKWPGVASSKDHTK